MSATTALGRMFAVVLIAALVAAVSALALRPDDRDYPSHVAATLTVTATGCRNEEGFGIGTIIEPGFVLTSAHTVLGATDITLRHDGAEWNAAVVAIDTKNDLAILEMPSVTIDPIPLIDRALTIEGALERDASVVVYRDGAFVTQQATIVRRVRILTEDAYIDAEVARPGYELRTNIRPGDSGALVVLNGKGVAVVWSRSRQQDDRAWAIDPVTGGEVLADHLANGIGAEVDLARC